MTAFKIDTGVAVPPANKGGRPLSERLAKLDMQLIADVDAGLYTTDAEAAEAYLSQYAGYEVVEDGTDNHKHKKKDITKRIKAKRLSLQR